MGEAKRKKAKAEFAKALNEYLATARSIADAFEVYRVHIIPKTAGATQVQESRRVFFAAVDWYFKRMLMAVEGEEVDAMLLMSEISEELDQHVKDVLGGKA